MKKFFNTLQFKIIFLFSLITVVAGLATLLVIGLSSNNLKKQTPPPFMKFNNAIPSYNQNELNNELEKKIIEDRQNQHEQLLITVGLIISAQVVLIVVGGTIIVRKSLSPLDKLNKTMSTINSLNLNSKIIENSSNDEISTLIGNYNAMITRIHVLIQKEKEFMQNISHELKTPLSVMRVNLESILLSGNLNNEDAGELDLSIKSIDELSRLIDDLTLLSRLDKNNFVKTDFDLISTVEEAVSELRVVYKKYKQAIKLKNNGVISYFNQGSPALFKRAIANLIENAIKYNDKKNPKITIDLTKDKDKLIITIADNGRGISADYLTRIFERFYRIDTSRSKMTGGSGLGLSITKEIIEKMGGSIEVSSKLRKGTKFTIIL